MGVRLKEAVPEEGATQPGPVAAAFYQRAKYGIPGCAGCGAKLKHVPAYSKHSGNTEVSAHFGLRPGHKHASSCKYDVDATLRRIVAKSREVRDLGAAVLVEHVGSREQETVEFRLHVLRVGLESERILGRQDKDPETAYAYHESERRLTAYMNCVESIVMVADVVGDDAQLEEKVHVVFNGEKIPWKDFFFGFKEYRRLWRARDRTQGHLVTLEFERRELERNVPAPYLANGHYEISGHFDREEGNPPYNVQVQLQVEDKALADAIWRAKQVVVCGVPRFRAPDFARWRPGGYPAFAHIVLPVRIWSQVFAVGGGPLEAPPSAADEQPAPVAPRDTAMDMLAPSSGVPATGMPTPEAQSFSDVPLVEDAPPGGNASGHPHPEPEEDKYTTTGTDKAGGAAGSDAGKQVLSSRQADPEPGPAPLDPQPVGPEALSKCEAFGDAGSLGEWMSETEKTVACPDNRADTAQTPAIAEETPQPTVVEGTAPVSAASADWEPEQEGAQSSPHEAAVNTSPPTSVASDTQSRRSCGPMASVATAVKQRATKAMERGRSARRRLIAWFGSST